ncbi:hypothetical protein M527_23745 [Sphingobium indicum IP26]|uniref:Uncharacterized protein n=1 Tax=Sphingobium indicum F2 TaxID=1450518 RepID=A0A8E0WQA7_9SPHN|nr:MULTISPECIES: hypothetical protein [Sphingobium]EPR15765.1 hypothetical protein M527_23745 [Sphingobium indicum IP26]KER35444.1 hypothetical protein AL00_15875 [Sphingobium indicum F2]MCB4861226.1 hypothetical protein [Sphingobium sp. PNB]UXC90707.1 hypothetical protein EGM87_17055 [Sphingobium sp. RSMS]
MSKNKAVDTRVSITIHVTPPEARRLEVDAANVGKTRSALVRSRVLRQPEDGAPLMACLAQLLRIHHRLDDVCQLDDPIRRELLVTVRALTEAARAEAAE